MSSEALRSLKYVRLVPSSAAKMGILFQLAFSHNIRYGVAYPGIENLCARCGCKSSSMKKHLDELARAIPPALVRIPSQGGRGRTNRYRLPWYDRNRPYELAEQPIPDEPYVIRWESTAKRKLRLQSGLKEGSEYSDRFTHVKGPIVQSKQSEDCSKTVRRFGPNKSNNYIKRKPQNRERTKTGLTSIAELLTNLMPTKLGGSSK